MTRISFDRIIELAFDTALAYFVFFFSLASVPYAQALWEQTAQIGKVFDVKNYVVIAEARVQVEVVDSDAKREKGLSGRASLNPGTGMLFVFDESAKHSIWMKDMLFPIDIIWIADNMQVIHVEENISPETFPVTFQSDSPARFVLEVPAGFISKEGIKYGDLLTVF